MNNAQKTAAMEAMIAWLSHPQELGKAPHKIEQTGEFRLHDMDYGIFRYKKHLFGKWLLGVCGGYEGQSTEHCGHIFSQMREYRPETAEAECIHMVEAIRAYWMRQAGLDAAQSREG